MGYGGMGMGGYGGMGGGYGGMGGLGGSSGINNSDLSTSSDSFRNVYGFIGNIQHFYSYIKSKHLNNKLNIIQIS